MEQLIDPCNNEPDRQPDEIPVVENPVEELSDKRTVTFSSDKSSVIITGSGIRIIKKSERLIVSYDGKILAELPLFRLRTLQLRSTGILLSSDVVKVCCERHINIFFQNYANRPYALLCSATENRNAELLHGQFRYYESGLSGGLCRSFILGKINNQRNVLKYGIKNLQQDDPARVEIEKILKEMYKFYIQLKLMPDGNIDIMRYKIMGCEGKSAVLYWKAFAMLLKNPCGFEQRTTHGKTSDPVNALLNYGYAMLSNCVWNYILEAGLNPYAGFLHADEPGRLSLVYDLVEEFRAPVVDRTVLAYINRKKSAIVLNKDGLLPCEDRDIFTEKMLERIDSKELYLQKHYQVKNIIKKQVYQLANVIQWKKKYYPYTFKW